VQTVANCELPVLTYLLYPTVRSGSGKISESTEMFGCAEGLLFPLKPGAGAASSAVTSSVAGAVKDSAPADAVATPPALPSRDSASASGQPAAPASTTTGSTMGVAANTRLITFDSTDPEFDEDSDPDADLDL
jgi:hypothetical protein